MRDVILLAAGLIAGAVLGGVGGFAFTSMVFFADFDDYMDWVEKEMRTGKRDLDKPFTRPRDLHKDVTDRMI